MKLPGPVYQRRSAGRQNCRESPAPSCHRGIEVRATSFTVTFCVVDRTLRVSSGSAPRGAPRLSTAIQCLILIDRFRGGLDNHHGSPLWPDRYLTFRRRRSLAKLETMIKDAIARGARRQVRVVVTPLRQEVVRLRRKVTDLQATVTTLRRSAVGWKRLMEAAPAIPQVSAEDAKAARLSPRLIESLRRRLGLSQMALAQLVGVSAPAVAHWVAGDSLPTGQNRMTLVALRKVGKREVKDLLARRVKETASRRPRTRKRPARRPRKRLKR
jgi:DNA-binding transcriptional regulator YiaG